MQCVVTTSIKILPFWFQVWQSWPLGNINQLLNAFCRLPLTTVTVQRYVALKKGDVKMNLKIWYATNYMTRGMVFNHGMFIALTTKKHAWICNKMFWQDNILKHSYIQARDAAFHTTHEKKALQIPQNKNKSTANSTTQWKCFQGMLESPSGWCICQYIPCGLKQTPWLLPSSGVVCLQGIHFGTLPLAHHFITSTEEWCIYTVKVIINLISQTIFMGFLHYKCWSWQK